MCCHSFRNDYAWFSADILLQVHVQAGERHRSTHVELLVQSVLAPWYSRPSLELLHNGHSL